MAFPPRNASRPLTIPLSMLSDDRREFQRLKLPKPILATMGSQSALILDIGIAGAFIEHYGRAKQGDRFPLAFRWRGEDVEFLCEIVRSTLARSGSANETVSHSGVRFVEGKGKSGELLQGMMATFVGRLLAAQRANSKADPDHSGTEDSGMLSQLGQARRLRTRGYLSYRWDGKAWSRIRTSNPAQPRDGFTVAGYEDEDELETLCEAYQAGDDEARQMIRLVAELSVLSARN